MNEEHPCDQETPYRIIGLLLPSNVQNTGPSVHSTAEWALRLCNSPKHWGQWAADDGCGDMKIWGLCVEEKFILS